MSGLIRFVKGMTVWLIPIRYWEDEYPIKPLTVTETMGTDSRDVYARDEDEDQSMYYGKDRVFYRRENAERARKLMTELKEIDHDDGTEVLMEVIFSELR